MKCNVYGLAIKIYEDSTILLAKETDRKPDPICLNLDTFSTWWKSFQQSVSNRYAAEAFTLQYVLLNVKWV